LKKGLLRQGLNVK